MWPLPEPTRPEALPDGEARWDPPVLVRLSLDHGLDAGPASRTTSAGRRSADPGSRRPGGGTRTR
ncbi:hypothetical protein [Klenkia terrae]|jgi:hypothetical protein|uniref:Uncharacterized protein n=1 Tax=Klenkia terrae TaxID=1052259 RepID=A0ABU8E882_9ACTN|nr:hypothetical protein [Klenkia terrae]SSC23921.1 Hypothetical protein KLENKIAIHU_2526 [Klenkia terrae]